MKLKHVTLLMLFGFQVSTITTVRAQDIHLSQFFETPLLRNPALAGVFTGDIRLHGVYRNQWASVAYPYQTSVFNGEYKFGVGQADDFMTIGLSTVYDVAGVQQLKTLQVMPVINFHKSLNGNKNSYLSAGFMAGFVQRQFNGKNLTFDNQYQGGRYNPFAGTAENFIGLNSSFADMATGLSYNSTIGEYTNYYIGASYWHFNKPKASYMAANIQLNPKWQLNAGIKGWISDKVELQAELNYLKQGQYTQTIGGVLFSYSLTDNLANPEEAISALKIGGGVLMRLNDAIIPMFKLSYNHIDVGISYDINTSNLKTASQGAGGYELSLSYRAFTHSTNSTLNSIRCPRF
ncbi:MAG: PorP/SprF family type IX secretion system membrane protein [Bacteroidota bacterium]